MKYRFIIPLILITLLTIVSCWNQPEFVENMVPELENSFGKSVIELLIENEIDSVYKSMESSVKTEKALTDLAKVGAHLTQSSIKKLELIDFYSSSTKVILPIDSGLGDKKQTVLKYELEYENYWILAEIIILNVDGKLAISGIHTNAYNEPITEINQFSIFGGSEVNFIFLLIALAELAVIFYVLVRIFKIKPKRKWLWIVFTIVGFFKLNSIWGTSTISLSVFAFQFFGVSFYKPDLLEPYILSISVPLGAIMFLIKYKLTV